MEHRDMVGAGIGSGLVGAVMFGIIALMAIQFQLREAMDYYTVGVAALIGALIFGAIGRAAVKRLPPARRP
jgi:uncharacterized membrane protein YedE/YeeE